MWTIIAIWLALQLPLGMLVGKCIKLGELGDEGALWVGRNGFSLQRRRNQQRTRVNWGRHAVTNA